ncbi:uncharacterized protein LOC119676217 [Teleopsis dalmanni]|uniref:uncharacterized protein LOC119676217 n=1 Tax=Teleopsis dalmanni TaxID=139649 RepID=UPI0018CDE509|nr:uncharacterized protein LOC119676217 [Teleopsis dalmanni]
MPLSTTKNVLIPSTDLIAAVRNGTIDFSAGLTFPSIPPTGFSYPYEQMDWCVVVPVEADIPSYEFYIIVFEASAFGITVATLVLISMILSGALYLQGYRPDLLDILMHDNCLRGALGQSFVEIRKSPLLIRFIYLKICLLGILLTTTYNSYFATYVTSAPKEAPFLNFDDVLRSGLLVYAWTPEYNELVGRVKEFKKYERMFYRENSFQKYIEMRDSFNIKYGYMMPTTKWTIVNEQQKIFRTPILRYRKDLCFFNNIPMCFPVHQNSIFSGILYQLILETAQSGLTRQWEQMGFLELIAAGKLNLTDLSKKREYTSMQMEDLKYDGRLQAIIPIVIFL